MMCSDEKIAAFGVTLVVIALIGMFWTILQGGI